MIYARFTRTVTGGIRFDGKYNNFYAAAQPQGKPSAALVIGQDGIPARALPDGWGCDDGDMAKVRDLWLRFFSDEERDIDETYDPYGD